MKGLQKRILLISREEGYNSVLVGLLNSQGCDEFEMNQVYPVEKALGELNDIPYDLIVLDVPDDEDYSVITEEICKINGHLPLIILTKQANEYAVNAVRKGAHQVIEKSNINAFQLSQSVLVAIDRKNFENEIRTREAILQAVNHAAEIFLTQPKWNLYIDDVLADLGQATKSDRVYFFQKVEDENNGDKAVLCAEWAAEGLYINKTEKRAPVKCRDLGTVWNIFKMGTFISVKLRIFPQKNELT